LGRLNRNMPKQWKEWKELTEEGEEAHRGEEAEIDAAAELPQPDEEAPASPAAEARGETETTGPTELELLKAERDQLVDRLARLQAEFENARKRAERERVENREFVTGSVVEQFLPVLDNFDLALKAKGSTEQLRSGVELIVKQMEEILNKMQVNVIPTVGVLFDPRVHEALGTVDRDDIPDQHVAEEIRRGYRLRERLIRPAMVRVANNAKQVNE
jgi:molecular chaperone GrpE